MPQAIIAKMHKGMGVSFMKDKMEWHYLPMTADQYQQALAENLPRCDAFWDILVEAAHVPEFAFLKWRPSVSRR